MTTNKKISIHLNGESKSLPQGTTVRALLEQLFLQQGESSTGGKFAAVAVEINSEIIPHDQFGTAELSENDHVEVVTLVGGG